MAHYTIYYSDPGITSWKGFGKVAHLPCVFDGRPGYHRDGSQYLIDRGLGVWHPRFEIDGKPTVPPTATSIRNYAAWLVSFLDWADTRGVDPVTCSYVEHVHGRYQSELLAGSWSRDARGLSPATVNLYVQQACDYLAWMAFKGRRGQFVVPTTVTVVKAGSATSSRGHVGLAVTSRVGKVRQPKRRLRMPTDSQIRDWLASVYKRHGETRGLMCDTVLMSAMRREEVSSLRIDTLPLDIKDWHITNPTMNPTEQSVLIELRFGAKGRSYGTDHGDKIGPARQIHIPLHLADRLHAYREKVRPRQLGVWVRGVRGAQAQRERRDDAVHLFRDEASGRRLTGRDVYEAWTKADLPFRGWSPHLGRDWWACSTLWREIKLHEQLLHVGRDAPGALLAAVATDIIRLKIQPQLGHQHDRTSFIYLQWVSDMLGVALPEQYQRSMDEPAQSEAR